MTTRHVLIKRRSMSDEYNVIDEFLDDCMDLIDLREARAAELYEPSVPLDEVIKELKKGYDAFGVRSSVTQ